VVTFRVLSRTNLAYAPATRVLNPGVSEICRLFNSLCALFSAPVFCFQQLVDSFCKTAGWRVPPLNSRLESANFQPRFFAPLQRGLEPAAAGAISRRLRCTEAQKCRSVSPLFATLIHSSSRKSFACHSYANTQDGGATIPAACYSTSRDLLSATSLLSYSLAPICERYESLSPQPLSFHIHPNPQECGGIPTPFCSGEFLSPSPSSPCEPGKSRSRIGA